MIAVTALGSLDGRAPVLRSGARPGDEVCIIGDLGVAARGLDVLFAPFVDGAGEPVAVTPERLEPLDPSDAHALGRPLAPHPPLPEGVRGAAAGEGERVG